MSLHRTAIPWTDATWNPIVGCSRTSPGCAHCYAATMARRLRAMGRPEYQEAHDGHDWTGRAVCIPERLEEPLAWRKPRRIFVCSMGDLFHPTVPASFIGQVFGVMAACPRHTFQVLTKRPAWMADLLDPSIVGPLKGEAAQTCWELTQPTRWANEWKGLTWPLPNVWLGTTVEDQARADERIPHLLRCPAAVRFVSCEPLLGPVDMCAVEMPDGDTLGDGLHSDHAGAGLSWVIAGGESGPGARPMHPNWARSLRDQCASAKVPFFFKSWGAWHPVGWSCCVDEEKGEVSLGDDHRYPWRRMHKFPDGQLMARMWHGDFGGPEDDAAMAHTLDGREHRESPDAP